MYLPELTLAAFSIFNVLRLGSYLPQIIRIARDEDGAKAISYSTWAIWIGANASTAAYAVVNIGDLTLFFVSAVNALCCAIVVGLTAYKRGLVHRAERAVTDARDDAPPDRAHQIGTLTAVIV